MKKIKTLVAQIDELNSKMAALQGEHDSIKWGPNMPREVSARGREIGREARAISKTIDLLRTDIVNAALAAYSTQAKTN